MYRSSPGVQPLILTVLTVQLLPRLSRALICLTKCVVNAFSQVSHKCKIYVNCNRHELMHYYRMLV